MIMMMMKKKKKRKTRRRRGRKTKRKKKKEKIGRDDDENVDNILLNLFLINNIAYLIISPSDTFRMNNTILILKVLNLKPGSVK